MLILEKIQELNELSENIKQSILNAQNEIKKETESKLNQEKQTLKENIANELESKKSDLESAAQTKLNEQIQAKKQELEQFISQNLATNAQNISQKLENTAQEALTNAKDKMLTELEKSLRAELETNLNENLNIEIDNIVPALAQEKTEDFLNERANELIKYEKIPIDSEKLAKNIINQTDFSSFCQDELKSATKEYFLSQKGEETLINIAKDNAPKIYKDTLKQDEILKMRYDCALRLASLKFYGVQEILGHLLNKSAKIVRDSITPDLDSKTNSFLAN